MTKDALLTLLFETSKEAIESGDDTVEGIGRILETVALASTDEDELLALTKAMVEFVRIRTMKRMGGGINPPPPHPN
jgi:hypothetical protein